MSHLVSRLSYLTCVVILAGCATYSGTVEEMERQLAAGDPASALALLESRDPPERDRVLFLLDKAMLLRLSGDFAGSNAAFESAKGLMERLAITSASETAGSLLINDGTRSYVGEPFEQALLHAYAALNYLDMQALDEARVEALQVDERLRALMEDDEGPLAQDPFARYLAGLIYEAKGESSDALISYRLAYEAYQAHGKLYGIGVPETLKKDLLRLTEKLGAVEEHEKLKGAFGPVSWPTSRAHEENGEVIVFLHQGLAPVKREQISVIYPPFAPQLVSVALPYYLPSGGPAVRGRLTLGHATAETETVEDVAAIARASLEAAMPLITARAVARAVAKYQLTERARKEGSAAAGVLTNLAGFLTERADTRSWLTLPGEIQMARVVVPPGDYRLHVELLSAGGESLASREFHVQVERGGKSFLSCHWVSSLPTGRSR